MSKNIPHADLLRGILDGKTAQIKYSGVWSDLSYEGVLRHILSSSPSNEFRLKPEPIIGWVAVYRGTSKDYPGMTGEFIQREHAAAFPDVKQVLRVELDPETLEVISATTEKP